MHVLVEAEASVCWLIYNSQGLVGVQKLQPQKSPAECTKAPLLSRCGGAVPATTNFVSARSIVKEQKRSSKCTLEQFWQDRMVGDLAGILTTLK